MVFTMFFLSKVILFIFRFGIVTLNRLTGKRKVYRLSVTHLSSQKRC